VGFARPGLARLGRCGDLSWATRPRVSWAAIPEHDALTWPRWLITVVDSVCNGLARRRTTVRASYSAQPRSRFRSGARTAGRVAAQRSKPESLRTLIRQRDALAICSFLTTRGRGSQEGALRRHALPPGATSQRKARPPPCSAPRAPLPGERDRARVDRGAACMRACRAAPARSARRRCRP